MTAHSARYCDDPTKAVRSQRCAPMERQRYDHNLPACKLSYDPVRINTPSEEVNECVHKEGYKCSDGVKQNALVGDADKIKMGKKRLRPVVKNTAPFIRVAET